MNYYSSDLHSNTNPRMCQEQIRLSAVGTSQKKSLFSRYKKQADLSKMENTQIKSPSWKSHLENSRL